MSKKSIYYWGCFFLFTVVLIAGPGLAASDIEFKVGRQDSAGSQVPGELIMEVRRGVIDLGIERGFVPAEQVTCYSDEMKTLNTQHKLRGVEWLFSGTRKEPPTDIYVFRFPSGARVKKLVKKYNRLEDIFYVEPNLTVHAE